MTWTIQQAIDTVVASVPGAPFADTVDTVKAGDPSQELTGIVVTFLATCDVIEKRLNWGPTLSLHTNPPSSIILMKRTGLAAIPSTKQNAA